MADAHVQPDTDGDATLAYSRADLQVILTTTATDANGQFTLTYAGPVSGDAPVAIFPVKVGGNTAPNPLHVQLITNPGVTSATFQVWDLTGAPFVSATLRSYAFLLVWP